MRPRLSSSIAAAIGILLIVAGVVFNEWTIARLLGSEKRFQDPIERASVLVAEVLLVTSGVLLLRARHRLRRRDVALSLAPLGLLLLAAEAVLRFVMPRASTVRPVDYVGWAPRPNVHRRTVHPLFGPIVYSTTRDGFRRFGSVDTPKTKIFVLGDSFTEATTVTDGRTFYDYLAIHEPSIEVFAYGGTGYGTLQEYLILDRYFDVIRPDVVLLQFSSNDLVYNDRALETASLLNNHAAWRPYYENGRIVRAYPARMPLVGHSYVLGYLSQKWRRFRAVRLGEQSIEYSLTPSDPAYQRTVRVTEEIMRLVKRRVGEVPVVAFTADHRDWAGTPLADIARRVGVRYVDGVADAVSRAKASGLVVDASSRGDDHWNAAGSAVVGAVLLRYLREHNLVGNRLQVSRTATLTTPALRPWATSAVRAPARKPARR